MSGIRTVTSSMAHLFGGSKADTRAGRVLAHPQRALETAAIKKQARADLLTWVARIIPPLKWLLPDDVLKAGSRTHRDNGQVTQQSSQSPAPQTNQAFAKALGPSAESPSSPSSSSDATLPDRFGKNYSDLRAAGFSEEQARDYASLELAPHFIVGYSNAGITGKEVMTQLADRGLAPADVSAFARKGFAPEDMIKLRAAGISAQEAGELRVLCGGDASVERIILRGRAQDI